MCENKVRMYFAVTNANGPISVRLRVQSEREARKAFESDEFDARQYCDDGRCDVEDYSEIWFEHPERVDEIECGKILGAHGFEFIGRLDDKWELWSIERDDDPDDDDYYDYDDYDAPDDDYYDDEE